jgi:acyl carrier protein
MVFEKLVDIMVEELGVEAGDVTLEANLAEDLGADSLDAVELIMTVEEEFDIKVPQDEAETFLTVKQIVDFIEKELAKK